MDLYKVSDELYALSDLTTDHLYNKIPKGKIRYYVYSASNLGKTVANTSKMINKNLGLRESCEARKIKINIIDKEYIVGKIKFRAEILLRKRHINIMRESINQIHECVGDKFTFDELVDIHVAHELYHFIEHDKAVKTNQILDKVDIFKIGPYTRRSTIVKTSEMAAHTYCEELLNLDFHPKALDYLYMLKHNMTTEDKLKDYFENLQEIMDNSHAE
jgi:hypothetical protein